MLHPLTQSPGVLAASVLDPLYRALAGVLAFFYSLIPNYAIAIALLTLVVMVVLFPLTLKSTRSMISMQAIAPEMKKLQAKYKDDRQKLNEEMMKLYKENGVNPMSGCLPMVLQLPVFWVLYRVIANLTHTVKVGAAGATHLVCQPQHVSHSSALYKDIVVQSHGGACQMKAFGIDLAKSATTIHGAAAISYWILVLLVVGVQYVQTRQLNNRNPAAAANPQAKMMQRVMPIVFGFISISIAAGVNIYFLVSGLFRIVQQEVMWRHDPVLSAMAAGGSAPVKGKTIDLPSRPANPRAPGSPAGKPGADAGERKGLARWLGGLADAATQRSQASPRTDGAPKAPGGGGNGKPTPPTARTNGSNGSGTSGATNGRPPAQNQNRRPSNRSQKRSRGRRRGR